MKRFFDLRGTKEQAEAMAAIIQNRFGGKVLVFSPAEAAGIPERVQETMLHHGIIGLIYGCGDGYECRDLGRDAYLIHGGTQYVHDDVPKSFDALLVQILKANQMGSHPVHNMAVMNLYLGYYHQAMGHYPPDVFEAGFGHDHLGQLLGCALHRIMFNGCSPDTESLVNAQPLKVIFNSLSMPIDLKTYEGDVCYGTRLEDYRGGPFSFVFSHVVYEHVSHPRDFTQRIFDLLAPDGVFITMVDLTGHSFGKTEYDFLYLGDEKWQATQNPESSGHVVNRMRHADYQKLFGGIGFAVESEIIGKMEIPADLQALYPGVDLSPRMARYICRKGN